MRRKRVAGGLDATATARHLVAPSLAGAAVAFAIGVAVRLGHPFRAPFGVSRTAFVAAGIRFWRMDGRRC